MYSKLFASILDSSVWLASPPIRIVWLTLLAAKDADGFARFATIENLSGRARVSMEEAAEAVAFLEAPDENSSNPDHEGRRIERVPGGWVVLNAGLYDEMIRREDERRSTRERVRRHRAKGPRGAADTVAPEGGSPDGQDAGPEDDIGRLLVGLPTATMREAWRAEINAARQGMHGTALTGPQIDAACRDYVGNGNLSEKPSLRHFRAFLRNAGKPQRATHAPRLSKQEIGRQNLAAAIARRAASNG